MEKSFKNDVAGKRTMSLAFIGYCAFFICFLVCIGSCFSPWTGNGGEGTFTIDLGGGGTSRGIAYPPDSATMAQLKFTAIFSSTVNGESYTFSSTGNSIIKGAVAAGTYNVSVIITVLADGSVFAQGEAVNNPVAIKGGGGNSITVNMRQGTVTVTFDANGGTGVPPLPVSVPAGTGIALPGGTGLSNVAPPIFGGWNTKPDGTGTNYSASSIFTPLTDITLYAKWVTGPITGAVTIGGDEWVNGTLSLTDSTTGSGTKMIQWKRDGGTIPGATSSTYTVQFADMGKTISVEITCSQSTGSAANSVSTPITRMAVSNAADFTNMRSIITYSAQHPLRATYEYFLTGDFLITGSWTPIGSDTAFIGTFDGDGKTITFDLGSSIVSAGTSISYRGIFAQIGDTGKVKNLSLKGSLAFSGTCLSNSYFGTVAGINTGTIENVSSSIVITTSSLTCYNNLFIGGIAGSTNSPGIIKNCYTTGNITVSATGALGTWAGGITGNLNTHTPRINNCWTGGNVEITTGTSQYSGGITGYSGNTCSDINKNVAINMKVSGNNAGRIWTGTVTGGANYADISMTGGTFSSNLTGKDGFNINTVEIGSLSWWSTSSGVDWSSFWGGANENVPWKWYSPKSQPILWFEPTANSFP